MDTIFKTHAKDLKEVFERLVKIKEAVDTRKNKISEDDVDIVSGFLEFICRFCIELDSELVSNCLYMKDYTENHYMNTDSVMHGFSNLPYSPDSENTTVDNALNIPWILKDKVLEKNMIEIYINCRSSD
ncbi:MAG: hypothetical protein ACTSPI_07645 [Candidatus Heimdallarchaeaceae archaeon]